MQIINIYISYLKLMRAFQIAGVLTKHFFEELFAHSNLHRHRRKVQRHVYSTPERLRMTIEELGPTFVKFGQILADRPDMVSEKFRLELKKLQSKAKPFDNENALALIEKELNGTIDSVFAEFDTTPLAAASIGQVYQGRLLSGEEVVVKIQRPFIENKIKLDIYLLKFLARKFAKRYPELAAINIVGLIDEFSDTILNELDYTHEATNILRFARMFKGDPTIHIPGVYTAHSTKRLIIMEKINGLTPDSGEVLRQAGMDTREVALNGANALLTMILRHGFFHADPHPGNIFILPGNVISFIDFGMVGVLTPRDMNFLADFSIGFARRDSGIISRALLSLCGKKFFVQEEELHFEIHQMMMMHADIPIEMINFADTLQSCMDAIVKYKLQIPSGIFMLIKALATLEKFASTLSPDLSLGPIILPYAKEVVKQKYAPHKIASELYDTLSGYINFIRSFPNDMSEILYKLKEGKIKHDIRLDDDTLFVKTIQQASRRVGYVVVLVGMFIGAILMISFEQPQGSSSYGKFLLVISSVLILFQMLGWRFTHKD